MKENALSLMKQNTIVTMPGTQTDGVDGKNEKATTSDNILGIHTDFGHKVDPYWGVFSPTNLFIRSRFCKIPYLIVPITKQVEKKFQKVSPLFFLTKLSKSLARYLK